MNTNPQHLQRSFPTLMFAPYAHWAAGFEYAFGYQLKLVREFWGLTGDGS